jgi:uncharacterized membrane protein YqaE (UPF0057 family)
MIQTIFLNFDDKLYVKKIPTDTLRNSSLTIKELFTTSLEPSKLIDFNYNLDNNSYFFLKDGHLILENSRLDSHHSCYISCHSRLRGGDILDDILKVVFFPFEIIFKPIGAIGNTFVFLLQFVTWLGRFIVWTIYFVIWLFMDLLNPLSFASDFFKSIMIILIAICRIPLDVIMSVAGIIVNTIGGWMQGFWGWDQSSLTRNDRKSRYFRNIQKGSGKKCYLSNTNTVPISIIVGTILCPPLGVFMDMGVTGWLNILICCLLTLLFYLPGLCYALLIIYS